MMVKLKKLIFPVFLFLFLLFLPLHFSRANFCWDECAFPGQKSCVSTTYYQTCGHYDTDYCLEWSLPQSCPSGTVCRENGECVNLTISHYTKKCYDNDLYWYDSLGNREEKAQECGEDFLTSNFRCSGNFVQKERIKRGCSSNQCYSYSQWENYRDCSAEGKICQNGFCLSLSPTVDIKANYSDGPITIPYNNSATLSWNSTNANSCQASGFWSGSKPISGSEETGNLTFSKTYTLTCSGSGGSASDSVTVNVNSNHSPVANAGPDKEIFEGDSVILEGSGFDSDGDQLSYFWSCNGGSLSNQYITQPIFYAPSVSQNTIYTCNLTVRDIYQAADSDTMNILVKKYQTPTLSLTASAYPSSGCYPLNGVDLTANVGGTASGYINYFFDCTNDGIWEETQSKTYPFYTAYDLCNYSTIGLYTARLRVEREGLSAEDTTQINVYSCYSLPTVDIKANYSDGPITIAYNTSATLSWSSANANSCYASGYWSGSKPTWGSEETSNLTYSQTYTLTCSNQAGLNSDSVTIYVSLAPPPYIPATLTIQKLVRNLSDGTGWSDSVFADPAEVLSFLINVSGNGSTLYNVMVKETLPEKISNLRNLKMDGATLFGNITSGINIGNLYPNQTRTITFDADLASQSQFAFGETQLINTVLAYTTQTSVSDTAKIIVFKKVVAGAATAVSTGITNNVFFGSFFLPLIIALTITLVFKSYILEIEDWLELKRSKFQEEQSKKLLQLKIAQIKTREFFKTKII